MTQLDYLSMPANDEFFVGDLPPGAFAEFSVRYLATSSDVFSGGPLVSSMSATAVMADGAFVQDEFVQDEADVMLEVGFMGDAIMGTGSVPMMAVP